MQLLLRTKPYLPNSLWLPLRNAYWSWFWKKEERLEEQALQRKATQGIAGSERAILTEAIADCYPFYSLIEIGCGYGQNFHTIAKQYPRLQFIGIDNNQNPVEEGQKTLEAEGISNVQLVRADARDLSEIEDNKFDLVICCGFLLYITADEILDVTSSLLRICGKNLLLMEQHRADPDNENAHLGEEQHIKASSGPYWIRDYHQLFKQFAKDTNIELIKVPHPRWEIEQWKELSYLIKVSPQSAKFKQKP